MSKIQDTGYKIQDKSIMHHASCTLHLGKKGFSLIEIIMIIVVVSIAIPALLILIGGEAGRGVEPELRITATNVAQQLMDEIMTKCWDETATTAANCGGTVSYSNLGSDSGDTDDIDDYIGVSSITVGGISYSRSVQVCYVPYNDLKISTCPTQGAPPGTDGTDYKRIAVTVTAPSTNWGSSVVLTTVMTNY